MSKLISLATLLLYTSMPCTNAAAVPVSAADKIYPEVFPGHGLPSLASLGLTSAELYQMGPAPKGNHNKRNKLFDPYCGGGHGATANIGDVMACYNYLQRISGHDCRIPADGDPHPMCTAGGAEVDGLALTDHDASSYCGDVALGVQYVYTHCNSNGQVEGDAAANGNGDLVIIIGANLGG